MRVVCQEKEKFVIGIFWGKVGLNKEYVCAMDSNWLVMK